jgi:hypothetical protein
MKKDQDVGATLAVVGGDERSAQHSGEKSIKRWELKMLPELDKAGSVK